MNCTWGQAQKAKVELRPKMMMGYECISGEIWGRGKKGKDTGGGGRGLRGMEVCCIYAYENSIMEPTNHCLKERVKKGWGEWEYNGGSKLLCMYGIVTMQPPRITNVWLKKEIKKREERG
jgi:hypothetical protein